MTRRKRLPSVLEYDAERFVHFTGDPTQNRMAQEQFLSDARLHAAEQRLRGEVDRVESRVAEVEERVASLRVEISAMAAVDKERRQTLGAAKEWRLKAWQFGLAVVALLVSLGLGIANLLKR